MENIQYSEIFTYHTEMELQNLELVSIIITFTDIFLYLKIPAVLHAGSVSDGKDNSDEYDDFQRPSEIQKKQKQKNAMADLVNRRKEKQEGLFLFSVVAGNSLWRMKFIRLKLSYF